MIVSVQSQLLYITLATPPSAGRGQKPTWTLRHLWRNVKSAQIKVNEINSRSAFMNVRTFSLTAILIFGAWLRLDQFAYQVVTDDEWHALFQLITHSPRQFLLSFGFSDYSIPLTLLYWNEANWFGLSELGMRWPMMLAGLLILILFPVWVSRHLGWRVALVFALLLAISPLLVSYSRNARPYALTLFLGYLAHYAFFRYWNHHEGRTATGVLYGLSAALSSWLHLISLPFVVAPILLASFPALMAWRKGNHAPMRRLLRLGAPTALLTATLILPPLFSDPGAMLTKSGSDLPTIDTLTGVWHTWLGSPSPFAVLVCLGLATLGVARVWKEAPLAKSAVLGLFLTLILLLLTRPAWIHNPLTFGRYLLPSMVLLLLAIAAGAETLASRMAPKRGSLLSLPILLLPVVLLMSVSPLRETMQRPNSYTLHSYFQFDYRKDHQIVKERMEARIPLSPWWATHRNSPRESVLIAVAPFYYFSPKWDAPRWERLSTQRVIPGFLSGLCSDRRDGELPDDGRFAMRNAVHLGNDAALQRKRVDFIAFQKPYWERHNEAPILIGADTAHCLDVLRAKLSKPTYEDDKIVVFTLQHSKPAQPNAQ